MEVKPYDIIDAFDDCLAYVYGRKYRREYRQKNDPANAQKWIDDGLTLPVACFVFYHQMSRMHERWMRKPESDREEIPKGLSIFEEHIKTAIRRASGYEVSEDEKSESQWRNRYFGWLKGHAWYENLWGAPPLNPDGSISKKTRMPRYLLSELHKSTIVSPEKLGNVISDAG